METPTPRITGVRAPAFAGNRLTVRNDRSALIARCAACGGVIYLRVDSDNAQLTIEHSIVACPNWNARGELRIAKVAAP